LEGWDASKFPEESSIMSVQRLRRAMQACCVLAFLLVGLSRGQGVATKTGAAAGQTERDKKNLDVPAGTVLPVRLNHGFSSKNAKEGQAVSGRIMQSVPLPNDEKIPEGAVVHGTIVRVERAANGSGGKLSFRFDRLEIHHNRIPIVANLRALAGFVEVEFAQTPETTPGFGTPYPWVTTRQIGGDEVYGVGGPVTDRWSRLVGKAVFGGVLVHVREQPGSKCRGALDDDDRLQALWVFSADACGVYGMTGVTIVHAGRTEPLGEITLAKDDGDVLVRGGSGILLRVAR
jgi:hypothetical protein